MNRWIRALVQPRRALAALRLRREVARLAGPKMLAAMAKARPDAFFIQVGANDGKMMDPLRKTIQGSYWSGLALEPVPSLFAQLRENYGPLLERVTPVNLALADTVGEQSFYHLCDQPGLPELPSWAQGLGSFRRDVILKHQDRLPGLDDYLVTIQVPCNTWAGLCEQFDVAEVDLVLTDTEGYDFEIVRQIDFERQCPAAIIYEHHHFDAQTRSKCQQLLKSHGYRLFEEGLDTWALQTSHPNPVYAGVVSQWENWVSASPYASEVG